MSEMLANYHFLIRDYFLALEELEKYLLLNPDDKRAKKKLIICYTQTGRLSKAFDMFYELICEDIDYIINTNPASEDCPCPTLVEKLENNELERPNKYELFLELGILWLYCNKEKSLNYFEKVVQLNNSDKRIFSVIEKIKSRINSN